MGKKLKIGTLISGGGTNMQAIVKACLDGTIDGEVVFVGADNSDAKGILWANEIGIDVFSIDFGIVKNKLMESEAWQKLSLAQICDIKEVHRKSVFVHKMFKNVEGEKNRLNKQLRYLFCKIEAEKYLLKKLKEYDYDLLVLAGYMQICTSYFIDEINRRNDLPRIINIHPALLPSFPGENGYEDTFLYGCTVGGCTVHFIDYGEDTGSIIGQRSFDILPWDTLDDVKKRGLELEYSLYPSCIQHYAKNRLSIIEEKQLNGTWRKRVLISETHNPPTTYVRP